MAESVSGWNATSEINFGEDTTIIEQWDIDFSIGEKLRAIGICFAHCEDDGERIVALSDVEAALSIRGGMVLERRMRNRRLLRGSVVNARQFFLV